MLCSLVISFFLLRCGPHRVLLSFPTRRSSDLALSAVQDAYGWDPREAEILVGTSAGSVLAGLLGCQVSVEDRKSTRLNSSHSQISYAVFCLIKKKGSPEIFQSPESANVQPLTC